MYWYCGYCWYIGISHSMSLCLYVTGATVVLLYICTGTVGTVGTLIPGTLSLSTNILLVLHWYYSLYVLVLWVQLVDWCQLLYVSVHRCYCYRSGTALYMDWYCGKCSYISTSHCMSLDKIFCWYCSGTALSMYWYSGYYWYIGTRHSMSLYEYVTGTTLVLLFKYTGIVGTAGTLVAATLCLCTNMVLVLHWYCSLFVLVLSVQLKHCCQLLSVFLPKCYWYHSGTAVYMYWYCGYCWYICTSHSMSLCLYVTGTTVVLLFIWTGTMGTVGTFVTASLCLCTNMLLVLHCYCFLYVLVLWVLLVHWCQPLYVSVLSSIGHGGTSTLYNFMALLTLSNEGAPAHFFHLMEAPTMRLPNVKMLLCWLSRIQIYGFVENYAFLEQFVRMGVPAQSSNLGVPAQFFQPCIAPSG